MNDVLGRVEAAAKGYPLRMKDKDWGEIEFRFDLLQGASEGELEKAERGIGFPLPAPFKTLLKRWNGPRLFAIWKEDLGCVEELRFIDTGLFAQVGQSTVRQLEEDERTAVVVAFGYGCEILLEPDRERILIHKECGGRYFYLCDSLTGFLEMVLREGPTKKPSWADESLWGHPI